ncbi:MAG: homocysteine S-methyltransferase [Actinobacteria bacterium]|nr:homocysteine S-methyltransferase [Actinomycetota bacterium]
MTDFPGRLARGEVILLDGGLATHLEHQGADLRGHLWSARLMLDEPAAIAVAQRDFLNAGAEVVTTTSYQASHAGFAQLGLTTADVDALLREDARRGRAVAEAWQDDNPDENRDVAVVGSIGPYGAMLNDGSEYRGDYQVPRAALRDFHARRLELLADECDLLALETIPQLREVEALLELVAGCPIPVWLSVSARGSRLRSGESAAEAFSMASQVPEVIAVGANCIDPDDAAELAELAHSASGKPAVIYPNSGEEWDAGRWRGTASAPADVTDWVARGALLVGGCCRVTPEHIGAMAESLGR